jgi:putative addiction module component (TIGR02574 family)
MDTTTLRRLSNDEKLRLVFELWDDLASSSFPVELSDEVIAEANHRRSELLVNPEIALDESEMWRRVDG